MILKNGSRGASVAEVQRKLAALGFTVGPADGDFGPRTEAAVKTFQRSRGLKDDGIAGPLTLEALFGAKAPAPKPLPEDLTREAQLRSMLVEFCRKDLGQRETNGKNRSPMIDAVNKRLGVPMGSPYCIGALLVRAVEPMCKALGLKNPVTMTAGTQSFYNSAPSRFRRPNDTALAKKGDIGILVNRGDAAHGHAFMFTEDEGMSQKTIEYNTDLSGSRDGDGVYEGKRHAQGTSSKKYRGAVDVVAWILEANP